MTRREKIERLIALSRSDDRSQERRLVGETFRLLYDDDRVVAAIVEHVLDGMHKLALEVWDDSTMTDQEIDQLTALYIDHAPLLRRCALVQQRFNQACWDWGQSDALRADVRLIEAMIKGQKGAA